MTQLRRASELYAAGRFAEALPVAASGVAVEPQNAFALCEIAAASAQALGNVAQEEYWWAKAIAIDSGRASVHFNLGTLLAETGREAEAESLFRQAIQLEPRLAAAHACLGRCHLNAGRLNEAERCLNDALRHDARQPHAHFLLGLVRFRQGNAAAAEISYRKATQLDPDFAEALVNLGDLLVQSGKHAEAADCLERAIRIAPHFANAHFNLGNLQLALGLDRKAEESYRCAIANDDRHAPAHLNLGAVLEKRGEMAQAEACFGRALAIAPGYLDAQLNLAHLHARSARLQEAEAGYRRVLEIDPRHAKALANLGAVLFERRRFPEAEAMLREAMALGAGHAGLLPLAMLAGAYSASWSRRRTEEQELLALLDGNMVPFVEAPALLGIDGIGAQAIKRATARYVTGRWRPGEHSRHPAPIVNRGRDKHLRIGYLSAHFFDHAVGDALVGVLEAHSAAPLAVHCYSYGTRPAWAVGSRIADACTAFHDCTSRTDEAIARQIAADGIDVLVDLVGFTAGCRPGITLRRPAPVQVNWLGYAGTLGDRALADYIVGDPVTTPPGHAENFAETLALLPECMLPYDSTRTIGVRPTRLDAGLPESGFVYCSFNQHYKINPDVFDAWCRLLAQVPGSVLWLAAGTDAAMTNLRAEASARGIAPERLVFSGRVGRTSEHLARLQLADLGLDTYPYGAHTTASDLLWAGVPYVTRLGERFASRVAGSLLHAVGLPDLVVHGWDQYIELAKNLASDVPGLEAIRRRLAANRPAAASFDAQRFARNLEALYRAIWRHAADGGSQPVVAISEERALE